MTKCAEKGCERLSLVWVDRRPWCGDHIPQDFIDPDAVVQPWQYGYERCARCTWPLPPRDKNAPEVRICFACWRADHPKVTR